MLKCIGCFFVLAATLSVSAGCNTGGLDVGSIQCNQLENELLKLAKANSSCTTDNECSIVPDYQSPSCDCRIYFGIPGGTAINENDYEKGMELYQRFYSKDCDSTRESMHWGICDLGPSHEPKCVNGGCSLQTQSCLIHPDGGWHSDDSGVSSDSGDADFHDSGSGVDGSIEGADRHRG